MPWRRTPSTEALALVLGADSAAGPASMALVEFMADGASTGAVDLDAAFTVGASIPEASGAIPDGAGDSD